MSDILILYSTTDGQTRKISSQIGENLEKRGHQVSQVNIEEARLPQLESFDTIVIGASIRYGKHSKQVYQFIEQNRLLLEKKQNAFFSVNAVARKPGRNQPDNNPYVKRFLKQITWLPKEVAIFAGKIDYRLYGFWDRTMIRFIMWLTKGPTDPNACVEFTDWGDVERFSERIAKL
jgi:menaquinone-dependent protoporphyrinogen oxidase